MPHPEEPTSFRCFLEGFTFECTAQRAAGREVRDYKVSALNVNRPTTLYSFDLIMVRTPPKYTANSIKINKMPLSPSCVPVPIANVSTKFIWLKQDWEPEAAEWAFARCMDHIVKHIKEQEASNAKPQ